MKTITLTQQSFELMFVSHIRYCLPRHSYMVSVAGNDIKQYWAQLTPKTQGVIREDIAKHLKEARLSHGIFPNDIEYWQGIYDWIKQQTPTD